MNAKQPFLDRYPALVNIPVGFGGAMVLGALVYALTFCAGHAALAVGRAINLHPVKMLDSIDVCLIGLVALCCVLIFVVVCNGIGSGLVESWTKARKDQ